MIGPYHIVTLGCKLNQFDSAAVEGRLQAAGSRRAAGPEEADVIVVNTCTVTASADAQSRRLVRRMRRENPDCLLIVMGCSSERDPAPLGKAATVDAIFGTGSSKQVSDFVLSRRAANVALSEENSCAAQEFPLPAFTERTRAFLKIQEGCDLRCSYCIIPAVRGRSRSLLPGRVEEQVRRLVELGYREIVLTGVNTGDYGNDLDPEISLRQLLERLVAVPGLGRLRLNSLEPATIHPDLISFLAGTDRVAPHIQIPLQSGSDTILGAMRRPYRVGHYARVVETLRKRIPGIALGADVIAGFPGEGDRQFRETYDFIAASPLNYLHVFPYSERPGTPAAERSGKVAGPEKTHRARQLRELGARLNLDFRRSFIGKSRSALILNSRRKDGRWRALSDNYIAFGVPAGPAVANRIVDARLIEATEFDTLGVLPGP